MDKSELKPGVILGRSLGGMSEFYEIEEVLPKTLVLIPIKWETCAPDNPDDIDPIHRAARICFDENGKGISLGYSIKKRIKIINDKVILPNSFYKVNDPHKKFIFYWG